MTAKLTAHAFASLSFRWLREDRECCAGRLVGEENWVWSAIILLGLQENFGPGRNPLSPLPSWRVCLQGRIFETVITITKMTYCIIKCLGQSSALIYKNFEYISFYSQWSLPFYDWWFSGGQWKIQWTILSFLDHFTIDTSNNFGVCGGVPSGYTV